LTYGTLSRGVVQSQAGILPVPLATDAILFAEAVPAIGRNVGVAIVNPNTSTNTVTLTLRDAGGLPIGAPATVTLQAQQEIARFIPELFSAAVIGDGFKGSLRLQSSTAFAAVGLRFSGTEFSAIPLTPLVAISGVPVRSLATANAPNAGIIGGASALVVPQFAMSGGWATEIALVNSGSSSITGRIDIFDSTGNPLAVKLNGATQSTFAYSIPSGGAFTLAPKDVNGQPPF
jgi:hypothetical protein